MSDRGLVSRRGFAAVLRVALALIWPQGLGARSPGPFGHAPVEESEAAKAAKQGPKAPPVLTMAPDLSSGPSR
jgi:hypothetical protein